MTIQWTLYDDITGAIKATGDALTEASARLQATGGGRVTLVGSDPKNNTITPGAPAGVDPGTLIRSPIAVNGVQISASKTVLTANGTDAITISPIPSGAMYVVTVPSGQGLDDIPNGTVTDGSLVITTTVPGQYSVTIKYQTNLDFTVTFNAS